MRPFAFRAFVMSDTTFRDLAISTPLLKQLDKLGFTHPTPIQNLAIPPAREGRDVVGIAQTGTGKTLAFGLPIAERDEAALVLVPTRELALQVEETLRKLNLKTVCLIGGAPMGPQVRALKGALDVVIATPGRLEDHLNQRTVDLRKVGIVVLDEADRMMDMGFLPAIKRILAQTPKERQTMLFSATMPAEIADLATSFQRDPVRVEAERAGTAAETIDQELIVVNHEAKKDLLGELLREHPGTVLVFARTRHGARKVAKAVRAMGHTAAELHSDRTLAQRRSALQGFKSGMHRVLVATDIAARGIDVKGISLVINYDLPDNPEDYVHRIGRTGRAGANGLAITMATPEQQKDVLQIEKVLRTEIPLGKASLPLHRPAKGGAPNGANHQRRHFSRRPHGRR